MIYYDSPDDSGLIELSEYEVIVQYWDIFEAKVRRKYHFKIIIDQFLNHENCIEEFITEHGAWQITQE